MKTYHIVLIDIITKSVTPIEKFKGPRRLLRKRLIELQKGYCNPGERPTIHIEILRGKGGRKFKVMQADSGVDFLYSSVIEEVQS